MAYRRSLSATVSTGARRCNPSFAYVLHDKEDNKDRFKDRDFSKQQEINNFLHKRCYGSCFSKLGGGYSASGFAHVSRLSTSLCRYMSISINEEGSLDKIELMSDMAEVISDTTVDQAVASASALNEVAIAAADSFLPIKGLQHLIDVVHCYTGLNWWASIVVTTLLIRGVTLPLLIDQLKSTAKLTLLRPHLEEIKQQIKEKDMDPMAMAEGQRQMQRLFKEYGVTPFTPMKGLFIQGPLFICFFLAISNMAEKVPSFKTGGAYWFLDLTTPDSLYIFPVLTALSFWIAVEYNMQEGMEGNPVAATMKNVSRGLAIATVPLTLAFPKAIFCYWLTSNLFSLMYGAVLKVPGVKKSLGLPEILIQQQNKTEQQPDAFSLFTPLKPSNIEMRQESTSPASDRSSSKLEDRKISSSSIISQRLRSLEKQVKARKKTQKK